MTSAFLATGKTPSRAGYAIILALIGIGWGSTQPLGKIAASTGHPPFGLIFWQLVVCVLVLGALTLLRGKRLLQPDPADDNMPKGFEIQCRIGERDIQIARVVQHVRHLQQTLPALAQCTGKRFESTIICLCNRRNYPRGQ